MNVRNIAAGVLASAAVLIGVGTAAPALASTRGSGGFLVGPVKSPGPIPIEIDNLSSRAHTYKLAEVETRMYSPKVCGPTTIPSHALAIPASVTVPAHKTMRIPVHVSSPPATLTDVAVRVTQDAPKSHAQVGVTAAVYAQEILGKGTASGCSVIRADYEQQRKATALAPAASKSNLPILPIALVVLVVAVLAFVVGRIRRPRGGTHRA
jgi:hypothetical protein